MDEKRENEHLEEDLEIDEETAEQVSGGHLRNPDRFAGPDHVKPAP